MPAAPRLACAVWAAAQACAALTPPGEVPLGPAVTPVPFVPTSDMEVVVALPANMQPR